MVNVLFFPGVGGIFIDWDQLDDNKSNRLYRKMKKFMLEDFGEGGEPYTSWILDQHSLYPQSGRYEVRAVINELKLIIKFMNDNQIPWQGEKVPFIEQTGENHTGFIIFKDEVAILGYVTNDGDLDTEYIPLVDNKKLY